MTTKITTTEARIARLRRANPDVPTQLVLELGSTDDPEVVIVILRDSQVADLAVDAVHFSLHRSLRLDAPSIDSLMSFERSA
jgi:hypothetical protein